MYIKKDLDFLTGYPGLDGRWVSQPEGKEPEILSITREHIHKATFTINKLVRDFPKALPKLVGDVDKWSTLHKNLLEILKESIHNEKPYPDSLADINPELGEDEKKLYKKLTRDNSSLSYVINSFSWILYLKPEIFKEALSWLNSNAAYLEKIYSNLGPLDGLKLIVELWRLSTEVGEKRINSIIMWVSNPVIHEITMERGYQYAYQVNASLGRKKNDSIPDIPKADFGIGIITWIDWLSSMQDDRMAKRSIDLFNLVCDISFIDNWEQWWKLLNTAIREAKKIPRPLTANNPLNIKLNNIREKIIRIGRNAPPELKEKLLFKLLKKWSEKDRLEDYEHIYKALCTLPAGYENIPVRMAFLNYWDSLIEENSISKHKYIIKIIDEFSQYIKWHDDFSKAVSLWQKVLNCWKAGNVPERYIFTIDDDILDEITDKKDISMIFDLLREMNRNENIGYLKEDEVYNFILLYKSVGKDKVLDCFSELRKAGMSCEYISKVLLRLAIEIAGQNCADFGIAVKILQSISERYNDIGKVLGPVINTCKTAVYDTFLIDAVKGGQLRILCGIALKAGIIEYFGEKALQLPPPVDNDKKWILRYPTELHDVLLKLAIADENADKTAYRILSKHFPDTGILKKEIDGLINKIEKGEDREGFLKLRIEKLQKRLDEAQPENISGDGGRYDNPLVLSEKKLKNLSKKLGHAAMIWVLNRWSDAMDKKFRECIKNRLDVEELPTWLERDNVQEIILSAGELDLPFQDILHKILVRRASSLPWDFRDEANNKAFIEKLEANNINMHPWLDGDDGLIKRISNGEEIIFKLERDPIEIFSMGLHFKTCLSPGGINFFSVFSNIIDINKQVVYGKTKNGNVRARALIALTDEGGLLTFYPYCNDPDMDFQNILKEFVHTLAKNMRTVVLAKGSVSKLIASDWYDDGPYDLAEKFPFTLEGSEFRKKVLELDAVQLLSSMKKAVEPLELNELTIPLFIFLPEIMESKSLIDVLLPYVLNLRNLSSDAVLKYSEALRETGRLQMLERLVPRIMDIILNCHITDYYWSIKNWIDLLIEVSPGKALMLLKKTRSKGIRTWEDDDGERIAAAGMAYLKLNRPVQASNLFSTALKKDISVETRELCIIQLEKIMMQ